MEKSYKLLYCNCIYYLCVFSFICSSIGLEAKNCDSKYVEYTGDLDYSTLGEYEDIYRGFEEQIEIEEMQQEKMAKGLFSKWGKKTKRWFKKRMVKLINKWIPLKKIRNSEDCAYNVAHFKRKVDKKLYKTGSIEKLLSAFKEYNENEPWAADMEKFKNRIRDYYSDKHLKPPKYTTLNAKSHNYDKEHRKSDLDDIPTRALIGGVEIACGCLISALPFPGCPWLGGSLILHGSSQIHEGYMQKYEREYKQQKSLEFDFNLRERKSLVTGLETISTLLLKKLLPLFN